MALAKSLRARFEGKALPTYVYRDYGLLVSLSRYSAVGYLMGKLTGSVTLEGWLARAFYASLYRMPQVARYGLVPSGLLMLGNHLLGPGTVPRLKLH
ncbi:NADH dehydrogenase II [Pseudomonas sp. RIT357]|nr:NADH dehydrogenase II [Pseudomonas sp. RIT357]